MGRPSSLRSLPYRHELRSNGKLPRKGYPPMRALVTGVSGFVGGHLVEHLIAEGDLVVGLSASGRWPADLIHLEQTVRIEAFDLVEQSEADLAELVRRKQPEVI